MAEKKNTSIPEGKQVSRTPALDRLLRIPDGFTEKMRSKQAVPSLNDIERQAAKENGVETQSRTQSSAGNQPRQSNNGQNANRRKKPAAQQGEGISANSSAGGQGGQKRRAPQQQGENAANGGSAGQGGQKRRAPQQQGENTANGGFAGQGGQKRRAPQQQGENTANGGSAGQGGQKRRAPQQQGGRKPAAKQPVAAEVSEINLRPGGRSASQAQRKTPLKIISLGGLGEIGKNITLYETQGDILVVDCGLAFPDNDMLGVDLVIPDFTYLVRNKERVKGIFITHGHEDHIGSLAYLLREVNVPVYATRLTIGLIEGKLKEHGLLQQAKLKVVQAGDVIKAGCMSVEFIHVNHSIPDACAMAIQTPAGVIVQTGDFKIDYTPIHGGVIDLGRFGELGDKGVLALLCDSTNAEKPGYTMSERIVGYSFDKLFAEAGKRRIIIATFASNVHRVQQVVDTAVKTGRKVAVFGRSMVNVVQKATELGYLKVKDGVIIDIDSMHNYTDDQLVIISTGSQGEPMSALTRMSSGEHRKVHIGSNDYIILSATPIPGNEKLVGKVINELMKLGAEVIYERMYDVHVSGHACQDEIKTLLALTKPRYFMPVHGEYKHLMKNAAIAKGMGYDSNSIIISDIGKVVETDGVDMKLTGMVPSGRVLVDGLGVGDVGSVVLRDRKLLSEDGLIVAVVSIDSASGEVLAGPDIVSRGFVYMREAEDMMSDARQVVSHALDNCKLTGFRDWASIKGQIRDELSEFIYTRTKRKPVILPVIQEV